MKEHQNYLLLQNLNHSFHLRIILIIKPLKATTLLFFERQCFFFFFFQSPYIPRSRQVSKHKSLNSLVSSVFETKRSTFNVKRRGTSRRVGATIAQIELQIRHWDQSIHPRSSSSECNKTRVSALFFERFYLPERLLSERTPVSPDEKVARVDPSASMLDAIVEFRRIDNVNWVNRGPAEARIGDWNAMNSLLLFRGQATKTADRQLHSTRH